MAFLTMVAVTNSAKSLFQKHKRMNSVWVSLLTLLTWLGISTLVGPKDAVVFFGFPWRGDGLWLLITFIMLASCVSFWTRSPAMIKKIGIFLRTATQVCIVVASAAFGFANPWGEALRYSLGSELYVAGILSISGIWLFFHVRNRSGWLIALGFYLLNMYVLWRLDVIMPLLLSILILVSILLLNIRSAGFSAGKKWLLAGIFVTAMLGSSLFWLRQHGQEILVNRFSHEGRFELYTKLFLAGKERPLFGWGWNQVHVAFRSQYPADQPGKVILLDRAHSIWLEWLVAAGWPGLVLFATFVATVCSRLVVRARWTQLHRHGIENWYRFACIWVIAYLGLSSFNVVSIYLDMIWWIIVGISASTPISDPT